MCIVAQKIGPQTAGLIPIGGNCLDILYFQQYFYSYFCTNAVLPIGLKQNTTLELVLNTMECVNCGVVGHSFRECKEPVLSFGICAVKFMDSSGPHYLLIRRRDSLSYVEFMRGKYKLDNQGYIQLLINGMTVEERGRLHGTGFDKLWETLWNSQNTRQYRNEYETAKKTFELLKNTGDVYGKILSSYVDSATATWTEPEWGFPKGRRSLHETELSCATREFVEETGLAQRVLQMIPDEPQLLEEYTGTNGIRYRQIYFLGGCAHDITATPQPYNRIMNREVGNIGWFSYEEALTKIRETNPEKRALLTHLHKRICEEGLGAKIRHVLEWKTA